MYTIPHYENRGSVPRIKIKMYSDDENTIIEMRYSLYFEAEIMMFVVNMILFICSFLILIIGKKWYFGFYIIIFLIFCDYGSYRQLKRECDKIIQYFDKYLR